MTCQDCNHYNPISDTEGRCDTMTYSGIIDIVDADGNACKEYKPKENSWESVSK